MPHSLRHTGIAVWIRTGKYDQYDMARMAGHRTPAFMYKNYGHLLPKPDKRGRDAIKELWAEAELAEDQGGEGDIAEASEAE